jgi:pimeloyl-ACP methyl ester carboxylesterase
MLDAVRRRIALPDRGVEISVLDWGGDGPLALLHHATGFAAAVWAPVAEKLSQQFRVVAIDARGHGDSTAPEGAEFYLWENFGLDFAAVAGALSAEREDGRVALGLGHSFGGTACLTAAASAPALFERLVLLDPVIRPPTAMRKGGANMSGGIALAERSRKRREVWPSRAAALAKWRTRELFGRFEPRALELYVESGLRDRPDGMVELKCSREIEAVVFESGALFDPWPFVAKVDVPTLVVWARDGNFPRAVHEALASELHNGQVRSFDGGHLMAMEQPDRIADLAMAFANEELPAD